MIEERGEPEFVPVEDEQMKAKKKSAKQQLKSKKSIKLPQKDLTISLG